VKLPGIHGKKQFAPKWNSLDNKTSSYYLKRASLKRGAFLFIKETPTLLGDLSYNVQPTEIPAQGELNLPMDK